MTLRCRGTSAELLAPCESLLPTLFITSEVAVETDANVPIDDGEAAGRWTEPGGGALVEVAPAAGQKCPRCWRYVRRLSSEDGSPPGVCERCEEALLEHVGAG